MSRPQEPHRASFPFGNPFRMMKHKGSCPSPDLLSLLNAFEERLAQRLRRLRPQNKDDILSLSWMQLAMELLCETHNDIKSLITDLVLPVCDWDDKWIDIYLNNSVKLLDICIAFNSEISRLNQGHLMLKCALHNLNSESSTQFMQARSSIDGWKKYLSIKNPKLDNCCTILRSLVDSLNLPKVKNSAKGKVLMRAMYGVKAETVFICGVFTAAFTGSSQKLIDLSIPETYMWADAFTQMQSFINGEIRNIYSAGRQSAMKDLEAVDTVVRKLYPMIEESSSCINAQELKNMVSNLEKKAEDLSKGLDLLTTKLDSFFQTVLTGRDALLCNLRETSPVFGSRDGENSTAVHQIAR
uniref:BPS1-like protein n=1 Tax=Kalanchoe fedtschenkoi TaxID=63787 RepID=A0A7N0U373_KALFE